jgi:hypothetical protein
MIEEEKSKRNLYKLKHFEYLKKALKRWRKSSEVSGLESALPGEDIMGGTTEGADMQVVPSMIAGGVIPDIPLDTDFLPIRATEGTICIFCPGGLAVIELGGGFVVSM